MLVGAMTRALKVVEDGKSRWVGVRFRPGGAFPFLRFSLGEATDAHWDLKTVWPEADAWAEELAVSTSLEDEVAVIGEVLARKLDLLSSPAPDARVLHAARLLWRTGGAVPISKLSERVGLSRQQLNRLFRQHVGLGVKRFSRIARLQASMCVLRSHGQASEETAGGAAVAARSGFFDQSHFISEFKALTGATPSQFLLEEQGRR